MQVKLLNSCPFHTPLISSRVRAGTRRIILDCMVVHPLTEVVEKVQTFEAASTFYVGMVSGFKERMFFDSIV